MKQKTKIYDRHKDTDYIRERIPSRVLSPNDCVVSTSDILSGVIAPSYLGTYDNSIHDGLNPLYRRGVDFTDLGNILASMDAMESRTAQSIERKRAELSKTSDSDTSE